jgi:hypothetical protein
MWGYMKKLRLLLTEKCNRKCRGCCNKDYDLKALPTCNIFSEYEEILLTGGEPMLYPSLICLTINRIRRQTKAPIYLYTASLIEPHILMSFLDVIDGITLTLHTPKDVEPFRLFNKMILAGALNKSLRLNVFRGISLRDINLSKWKVKKDMVWIKNCPIPKDEVFMRV